MKPEDLVGLIVVLVIIVVVLAVYIGLVVLGVRIAKSKNRSPHWMWFAPPYRVGDYPDCTCLPRAAPSMPSLCPEVADARAPLRILWLCFPALVQIIDLQTHRSRAGAFDAVEYASDFAIRKGARCLDKDGLFDSHLFRQVNPITQLIAIVVIP